MRAIVGMVWAACLLGAPSFARGQGITATPKPPSTPAATESPHATEKPDVKEKAPAPAGEPPNKATDNKATGLAKPPPPPPKPSSLKPKIELHGGAWLFYWQPFEVPDETSFMRLHFAHLNFDGSIGDFGLFFNISARDTRIREFYAGPAWIEEGYFYYKHRYVTVKVGKVYSRFGLFWDNSFYGNVHFYDGIKLDPNHGVSVEGSAGPERGFRLGYYGQYFIVDGRTNGSYVGRDTISIPGAFRRHMVVGRVEPAYFWRDDVSITFGLSGQYFQADLPEPVGPKDVIRAAADVSVNIGPLSAWADVSRQLGQSVTEWPIPPVPATATTPAVPGRASARNDYVLVGGEARVWKFVGRYNYSLLRFHDVGLTEHFHVPGLGYNMNQHLEFLVEFAHWTQHGDDGSVKLLDRSLATTIHGYF